MKPMRTLVAMAVVAGLCVTTWALMAAQDAPKGKGASGTAVGNGTITSPSIQDQIRYESPLRVGQTQGRD